MSEAEETGEAPGLLPGLPKIPFYIGTVRRVNYANGSGAIRTGSGRDVPFIRPFVDVLDGRTIDEIAPGMEVGFDVGWTSRGLRITKIKIFGKGRPRRGRD